MEACNGNDEDDVDGKADAEDMSSWPRTQCCAALLRARAVTLVAADTLLSQSFSSSSTTAGFGGDNGGGGKEVIDFFSVLANKGLEKLLLLCVDTLLVVGLALLLFP